MIPADYLSAARVPSSLGPQTFGLWSIQRRSVKDAAERELVGFDDFTLLRCISMASLHREAQGGEIVMEDSAPELRQHLPIWLQAHGRVLVTGLGLGCVVRGLLASPNVEHVDVIEINEDIVRIVGAEFADNPKVTIHHADALAFEVPDGCAWDFAWHDIWCAGNDGLQILHGKLIDRFKTSCPRHGAWKFPRFAARLAPELAGVR
jgi:hypothetical protein